MFQAALPDKLIILLQGPTGSGKSALALELGQALNAEIINADALQVYRDWQILSARPSDEELATWPHHLFGTIDAAERYSVGRWQSDAMKVIQGLQNQGKAAVVVGGTGLYFKALTEGLAAMPAIPPAILQDLEQRLEVEGVEALHGQLVRVDPQSAARIRPTDPSRVLRALAVFDAFGETITALHARTKPALPPGTWRGFVLRPDRERLYAKINARYAAMMTDGALEEAQQLLARKLNPDLPAMKAVGAPPIFAYLRQEISLDAAVEIGARDTRHYAKRQFTWINNQVPHWQRIEAETPSERLGIVLHALASE